MVPSRASCFLLITDWSDDEWDDKKVLAGYRHQVLAEGHRPLPTEMLTFTGQMQTVLDADVWLVPFQLLRGLAWAGLGWLALAGLTSAGRLECYLLVGLALSLPLAVPLLVPQGYMPMAVRIAHFPEVFVSNSVFGVAAGAAIGSRPASDARR